MKLARNMIICAALVLAAAGCAMAAAAGRDADPVKSGRSAYETKTCEVTGAFTDIRVEDAEYSVRILRAEDGQCRVVCEDREDGSVWHTVTVSGGELSVQRHDQRTWYQRIGVSFGSPDVEIYLPEEAYGRLTIRSTAGSIQVSEGLMFDSVRLESVSGSVRMLAGAKTALQAESASGSVTIENASPETLAAHSVSGRVTLAHIRSGELTAQSTSGRIELTDVIAARSLYARSVSGGVSLDSCDGDAIRIETTSGSVKGSILSGKDFMTRSTSGSVSVPRSAGGGECKITTTSGDIAIDIRQ